ncbi:MAG TPA: hypothetical protein VHL77_04105, partial [Ferruginibacter sp.]|nr:hypothetical protein [Ferruginibacter sp.]
MKSIRLLLLAIAGCVTSISISAQSLAINTDGSAADASAMLDVKSSVKGLLIPRVTKTEKQAIATPATGLLIFQSGPDSIGFYYYNGASWDWVRSSGNGI